MNKLTLREEMAAHAHEMWSGWMKYLYSKASRDPLTGEYVIPIWATERWTRQMLTAYADLPEEEKESDRIEADRILAVIASHNNDMR